MVFCNLRYLIKELRLVNSHNPYFSRWFSAIYKAQKQYNGLRDRHNPYFSRWFSAMHISDNSKALEYRHNPYFSRWFSAIEL